MQFGVSCGYINDLGFVTHAEKLGYDFAWFPDSPLMRSNIWAMMAIAAQQTQRIRLGTGLAIPGLRLAPVAANGIATINRLAPGRVFFGTGTGNTAMRTMGQRPARVAEFNEYLRVVRALLAGEEAKYTLNGATHIVRFQNTHQNYIDLDHKIPMMVGGFGPRAQSLAGELGDGVVTGIPRGGPIANVCANVERGAKAAGRTLEGFETFALANLLMLEEGETLMSERVIQDCGPAIMANVHYLVDFVRETGSAPPDYVQPIWDDYMKFHMSRDEATRHMKLHESHYSYLDPDEARFITPEIIRNFCIAGRPNDIVNQLHSLEEEGLTGIVFSLPADSAFRLIEDFARDVIANM